MTMIQSMQPLDPITIPLNSVSLIEASAGTGKTHTMASLYIRLLLQAGENQFPQALSVEQILMVTFTEMATQELRERIRERIYHTKILLQQYQKDKDINLLSKEDFLRELIPTLSDLDLAIQRLTLAEQNMDLAAIYTIHGFCHRVLVQYAFNSGVHFNLELVTNEYDLLQDLTQNLWREQFYHQPIDIARLIHVHLKSPTDFLKLAGRYLNDKPLKFELNHTDLNQVKNLNDFLLLLKSQLQHLHHLKKFWIENAQVIHSWFSENLSSLSGKTYREEWLETRFNHLHLWANNPSAVEIPEILPKYFTQTAIEQGTKKGCILPNLAAFQYIEHYLEQQLAELPLVKPLLIFYCIQNLREKLFTYKLTHKQKGFDDLLRLVKEALYSEQGEVLAQLIRQQYPFAMIDEFQDTDALQYEIFAKIYMNEKPTSASQESSSCVESGFIMIGDPKQSIYKFRGADIFTYLNAAQKAKRCFSLDKNWRSGQDLIHCVNQIFDFQSPYPFLYREINFTPVGAGEEKPQFYLNQQKEPAIRTYLAEKQDLDTLATACATSIQYWLKSAVENNAKIGEQVLQAKNIAVLVRTRRQAEAVKNALMKLGIASVYLSDRSNVFDSTVAGELLLVLRACINPLNEKLILAAVGCGLFNLTADEIYQIKQNENQWEIWVERFLSYQKIWQRQGILPMLHQILFEQDVGKKLRSVTEGERKLTDLLHLAELLQQAARLNNTPAALLRWYEKQLLGKDQLEENIRLESERELVKIVTIHKSKGLAYDLVWLPFIALPISTGQDFIKTYYDLQAEEVRWDIENKYSEQYYQEVMAEELRLLYVALTRAKYQVVMALPTCFANKWNALFYCLSRGQIGQEVSWKKTKCENNTEILLEALLQNLPTGQWKTSSIQELHSTEALNLNPVKQQLAVAEFNGYIERNWTVNSFTQLLDNHQWLSRQENAVYFKEAQYFDNRGANNQEKSAVSKEQIFDIAQDYDHLLAPTHNEGISSLANKKTIESESIEAESAYLQGLSPFDFPAGRKIGTALHHYFEKNTFSFWTQDKLIEQLQQHLQLNEEWFMTLKQWFNDILHTPLLPNSEQNICFANIKEKDCLRELQFYLHNEHAFDVAKFNQLLRQHHHLPSQPLLAHDSKGLLRGFIDLVFRHAGKYYIVDYKSNLLGTHFSCYQQEALQQAMLDNHYDWQYLIYCVALDRYLRQRHPNYDYEQHFGGVIYAFLRGMDGQQGVFFDRPTAQLIEELGKLF